MKTTRWVNEIIIHCSATKPNMDIGAEWIKNIHVNENKWADIGYHFVIRRNGIIEKGRDLNVIGAHVVGHNTGTIGVCLIGGLSENNKSENNFTERQFESAQALITVLSRFNPEIVKLSGHRDYANKDCPCFEVREYLHL